MKSLILLSFAFGLAMAAGTSRAAEQPAATPPVGPRPMTADDLWNLERISAPAVSPDGQWIAFVVTRFSMEENKGNGDLWLVASDGSTPPRRLTWNAGSDSSPIWSPDGTTLAFLSKRGEDPPQLYLLPLAGGEAEPLTTLPIAVENPKWFADGRRIAFAGSTFPDLNDDFPAVKERLKQRKDDKTQARITENRLLRYWDTYRTDGTVPHVFVVDLESREVKDLMPGVDRLMSFETFEWSLSPDGEEVAFAANATDPPWQNLNLDIFLLNVASGEIRNLTGANKAADGAPFYTPDGRYLLFSRTHRPDVSPDIARLTRYDRASGEFVELAGDWDYEPSDWDVTPDGQTIVFHAQTGGYRSLYSLPIDGGTPRLLVRGGSTAAVDATAAPGLLVYLEDSFKRPVEIATVALDGSAPRQLTHWNREVLAQLDFGTVEDVTYAGAGGAPVQMFVLFPPGFDPAKKWPLLMLIHGGPHGAWADSFHYRWNSTLLAAPGYVVAAVNFHGSTGFGQAFAESILGAHAEKPFEDVMKATDFLIERGYIDPKRLAAAGGSYGGYLVSWILGHTDRFAALINHAGVYDLMAQFASDYTWSRGKNYGAEPWEDPGRIDAWSPSRYAQHFKTPTLILHGELDYRVPVTQGINVYSVLTGKGVPARIVIFPNENHWVLKPQAAKLWWQEVFAWLERFIGKGPSGG